MYRLAIVSRSANNGRLIHTTVGVQSAHGDLWLGPERAAGREHVGYGAGNWVYMDRLDKWYPAIRFRKPDDVYRSLQAKEKGDWKKMSLEEKKTLYRYSFRQTRAEFFAPMGYWKPVTALVLYIFGITTIIFWASQKYCCPAFPPTMTNEWKELMLKRMIDLRMEPINGPASKWDYEKEQWKA